MRTIFVSLLMFAITLTVITKIAYPSLMESGGKVKEVTEQHYRRSLTNS